MPGGKVPARGSRVMHAVLYVESNGTTGSEARSDKRQPQGKNARQSHPGQIPLSKKDRVPCVCRSRIALRSEVKTVYPTRVDRSM
jgi:hypothetical protein